MHERKELENLSKEELIDLVIGMEHGLKKAFSDWLEDFRKRQDDQLSKWNDFIRKRK